MLSNEQINGTDLLVGGASVLLIISSGVRFNRFPSGWAYVAIYRKDSNAYFKT